MSGSNALPTLIAVAVLAAHLAAIWAAVGRGATLVPATWVSSVTCGAVAVWAATVAWRGGAAGVDGPITIVVAAEVVALIALLALRTPWVVWTVLVAHTAVAALAALFFAFFRMTRLW